MVTRQQFQDRTVEFTATILSGAALSSEIDLAGVTLCGIILPSSWTTAGLGLKMASASGGTFVPVYNSSGTLISMTVAASQAILLNAADFACIQYLKLWSQTAGVDTNQGADRVITLIGRPV